MCVSVRAPDDERGRELFILLQALCRRHPLEPDFSKHHGALWLTMLVAHS